MNDERKPSGFLKRLFLNIPSVIEYVIAAALIFAMVISMIIFIIREIQAFSPETFALERYLSFALSLVVGVEFVRMLILKTPGSLVEVVMFAIARQIIIDHSSIWIVFIGVLSIAVLYATRKYLFCRFHVDEESKSSKDASDSDSKN